MNISFFKFYCIFIIGLVQICLLYKFFILLFNFLTIDYLNITFNSELYIFIDGIFLEILLKSLYDSFNPIALLYFKSKINGSSDKNAPFYPIFVPNALNCSVKYIKFVYLSSSDMNYKSIQYKFLHNS